MKNRLFIFTILLALNTYAFAAEPLHNTKQQEQSWQQYLPTKKQVFIGACTIIAAGATVWYMRSVKKIDRTIKAIAPNQSTTIHEIIDLKSSIGEVAKTKTSTAISPGIENITAYRGSTHLACQAVDDQQLILDQFCFDTVSKKIILAAHQCNKDAELGVHYPRRDKQITFNLDNGTTVTFLDRWKIKITETND